MFIKKDAPPHRGAGVRRRARQAHVEAAVVELPVLVHDGALQRSAVVAAHSSRRVEGGWGSGRRD
jgi:hypothetical protein